MAENQEDPQEGKQDDDFSDITKGWEANQLSFEGMDIALLKSTLKSCKVAGLQHLSIGDKVRIEVEAVVVGVNHENDEKLGGVRHHVMAALDAKAIETL